MSKLVSLDIILSVCMITSIILNILGFVVFLFIFWKRLKEDYLASQVFTSAIYIATATFGLYLISLRWAFGWWFWLGFLGFVLGVLLSTVRYRLRFYETFEAAVIAFFPWLSLVFLSDAINNKSYFSLGFSLASLVFIFLFGFLNSRYKDFGWYKSGRIGFAGLTTLGIFFLTRGAIAIILPFMLSFVRDWETILSGFTAFFIFLAVFNLSRQSV